MSEEKRKQIISILATKELIDQMVQTAIIAWHMHEEIEDRRRRLNRVRRLHRKIRLLTILKRLHSLSNRNPRRWWIAPRSNAGWFKNESALWPDDKWVENLRMTRNSFYKLVEMLHPLIAKQDTRFRFAVPSDERVAMALYRLATNMFYRNIAQQFGRGKSLVIRATNEVIDAICTLSQRFISWPRGDDMKDTINGFYALSGFPMVVGAVDGSHIPVLAPADQREEYFCHKGYYSMNLQGVVDYRGRFINAFAGFAGRAHDARVFAASEVGRAAMAGNLFDDTQAIFDGVVVGPVLVADAAYPMRQWLMKAYPDTILPAADAEFNIRLNTARNVVERAFGVLKARFRSLRKQIDMDVTFAADLIMACCCLHNFCIDNNEVLLPEWENEAIDDEAELMRRAQARLRAKAERERIRAEDFTLFDGLPIDNDVDTAENVRNAIKSYILTKT